MGSSQTRAKFTASSFIKPMGRESRLALPIFSPCFEGRGGGRFNSDDTAGWQMPIFMISNKNLTSFDK